jgi:hypothetical protein
MFGGTILTTRLLLDRNDAKEKNLTGICPVLILLIVCSICICPGAGDQAGPQLDNTINRINSNFFFLNGEEQMNRQIITRTIILGIIFGLCFLVLVTMKQNGDQQQSITTPPLHASQHIPEEWVIASFGLDEKNPDRSIFLKDPALMDTFINASETDIGSGGYRKGLVLGYGKDMDGSIVVLLNPNERVNRTIVNEIYNKITARGKTFNITSVPCKFILMDVVRIEVPTTNRVMRLPRGTDSTIMNIILCKIK